MVGVRAEFGGRILYGEGGMIGAEVAVFSWGSWVLQGQLEALLGCVTGVALPEYKRSNTGLRPVEGVEIAGESAFRNSV